MTKETLIFGPPGCGKTHKLIHIVRRYLDNNGDSEKVGFVSFSKKAVMEARDRISKDLTPQEIPWFRTLHSIGYRWLGMRDENMMTRYDFNKLGNAIGVTFDSNTATNLNDGLLAKSFKEGNKYLEIIGRATMRKVSLEKQYDQVADHDLHWSFLNKIKTMYTDYKKENNKYDFTDMIELFVKGGTSPELDLLIVDEAQDLSPLQWDQVKLMKDFSREIWYAGDDDQCIHRWNGVEVKDFINACEKRTILGKSHRVPKLVHSMANRISSKIGYRQEKVWEPTDIEGNIDYHLSWREPNIDQGSWTIMARTNRLISGIAKDLRDDGYLFTRFGIPSIDPNILETMAIWKRLISNEPIPISEVRKLYKEMPKQGKNAMLKRGFMKQVELLDNELFFSFDELVKDYGLLASRDMDVYTVLNVSPDDKAYMRSIERKGEMFQKPRINLSTIHAMKGGEDDNIMLLTESYPSAIMDDKLFDDEHRVFYTGVTRTKHNLHIIDTESRYKYQL
jgi:superfamily I DNA/RNA helicase